MSFRLREQYIQKKKKGGKNFRENKDSFLCRRFVTYAYYALSAGKGRRGGVRLHLAASRAGKFRYDGGSDVEAAGQGCYGGGGGKGYPWG